MKLRNFLEDQGYWNIKFQGNKWYAVCNFLFTSAILTGTKEGAHVGYDDRWCYHTRTDAAKALDDWENLEFAGEPVGWHRHPDSGRRIDEKTGQMYVEK